MRGMSFADSATVSFDSFCFRGSVMKRTQRFKRVAEPRSPVSPSEPDDDKPVQKTRRQNQNKPHPMSISESNIKMETLPRHFFQIDALDLAPRLLGKFLRRDDVVLQITEVEAYRPNDSACHGRFGITPRTAPVFGPGGHAYVYLCYGLHMMLNVVADKEGAGAAVLIRSCAPISGLDVIQQRRGQKTDKPILLTGPGKEKHREEKRTGGKQIPSFRLCLVYRCKHTFGVQTYVCPKATISFGPRVGQALGLSTEWSNHPLYTPGGLELLDGPEPENILVGPRVGIQYASPEHVNALWRFAIAGNPWISAPRNTLRPP